MVTLGSWLAVGGCIGGVVLTLAATPAQAFVNCAARPLDPSCCPSPCPVFDGAKLAKLLDEAEQAWQQVEQCHAIALSYFTTLENFGPNGPLASELRRVPGNVSAVFNTFKTALPASLKPGDLADPRVVANTLKIALFDPQGLAAVTLTGRMDKVKQRSQALAEETVNALATGWHSYARLGDVALDGGKQVQIAASATDLRGDLAAGVAARQALADNLSGLHELAASWAAMEATKAADANSSVPAAAGSQAAAAAEAAPAVAAAQDMARRQELRRSVQDMDTTVAALTGLHNDRSAANLIAAQYPGLQNTIDSLALAQSFQRRDEATAIELLGGAFADGTAAFEEARRRLLANDTTGWHDSATKNQAAAEAAQTVVAALEVAPDGFGRALDDHSSAGPDGNAGRPAALRQIFAAWLEDDKLERFWHPLGEAAQAAKARLDQRLAEISRRRGFDISSAEAGAQEQSLIDRFAGEVRALPTLDGLDGDRRNAVTAMVAALQSAVRQVQSDDRAARLVTVAWPP